MKLDIETIRDAFEEGYEAYEESYEELKEVNNLYHNRHYTKSQLQVLKERGQAAETFNVIKTMDRALLGYFSTVINSIKATPLEGSHVAKAVLINKDLQHVLRINDFDIKKETLLTNCLHAGLLVTFNDVAKTSFSDDYGRDELDILFDVVDPLTVVIDPRSKTHNYKDGRYVSVFKWLSTPEAKKIAGTKFKDLEEYNNRTRVTIADSDAIHKNKPFNGIYNIDDEYLIVHTVAKDDNGIYWSIYWSNDLILSKKKVPYNNGVVPYRVVKLHESTEPEFYGIYREVIPAQHAINQALLQIQQLVNTKKVIVQDGTVEAKDWDDFQKQVTRINGILKVNNLAGIKFEDMSSDIVQQYRIIDKALERIKETLHVNDSFLGQAAASDSGRKVNMQKTSSIVALRYVVTKLEYIYKILGLDLIYLIKQYRNSTMSIPNENSYGVQEFTEVNKPIMMPQQDGTEKPAMDYTKNKDGSYTEEVINHPDTELDFDRLNIMVSATNFDDAAEADKLMLDQTIQGPIGQAILQINPQKYLEISALSIKQRRVKHSEEISEIIMELAQSMGGVQQRDPRDAEQEQGGSTGAGEAISAMGLSNEIRHPNER